MSYKEVQINGKSTAIKRFDLRMLGPNATICVIAKRGSGKSVLVKNLLDYYKSKIPVGMIIAPTDRMNCFYGEFVPDMYVHYEYQPDVIETFLTRQDLMIQKYKEKKSKSKFVDPRAFLVMDDCLSSKGSWLKDVSLKKVFMDGRHYKLVYILTMQFSLGIPPDLRSNFDYVFLLAEDMVNNKKRLYDNYAGMFRKFKSFETVFDTLTANYGCMVLSNRGKRKTMFEKMFWFKADPKVEIEKFGCSQYRGFHNANYNKDWNRCTKAPDIQDIITRRKESKFV